MPIVRPFLFLAGESGVTLMATFRRELWSHTCVAKRFMLNADGLHRENNNEKLSGVIYFADVEDKGIERHNLTLLATNCIPCWPNPDTLLSLGDRHDALSKACDLGFIDHQIWQGTHAMLGHLLSSMPMPFVLKTGTMHQGHDKHLINCANDIPDEWDGVASAEPFFDGVSYRVLVVGDRHAVIRIDNKESWIKNGPGADIDVLDNDRLNDMQEKMVEHALRCSAAFGLEVAGVDYVIDDGGVRFLEVNWYPGLAVGGEFEAHASRFLDEKMQHVERLFEQTKQLKLDFSDN